MNEQSIHKKNLSFESIGLFFKDIKIQHSIFALPFAAVAFAVADLPMPTLAQLIALLVCMVTARSWAMGFNRLLDRKIDAANPRTANRMIASGRLKVDDSKLILAVVGVVFVFSSFQLNAIAGFLSMPLLLILALYSKMKNWTWLCHYYLGVCLGFAPVAVSIAMTGAVTWPVILICGAITFWTAGFDILYALQDYEFDKKVNLKSIPSRYGVKAAKIISRLSFAITVVMLIFVGVLIDSHWLYFIGIAIISALLFYQHMLIGLDLRAELNLQNIGKAFFDSNALVSIIYCGTTFMDKLIG